MLKPILLLTALLLGFLCPLTARAGESYAILANGQRIQGDVPPGEDIRLEFPLAAGAEPRLTLTLNGAKPGQPVSISGARLIGPDGLDVVFPQGTFFDTRYSRGNPTLTFRGWTATQSGRHQLLISTNSRVLTHAKGRLTVLRLTKIPIAGDENSPPIVIPLGVGDKSSVTVKRVSGSPPKVAAYRVPSGFSSTPGQRMNKKGSTSNTLFAAVDGDFQYTIGYQSLPAAGQWKGTLRITPFRGGTVATLRLRNSPGVALSVRGSDRFVIPTFGGTGVGVATNGTLVVVTSESGGVLRAQAYDTDLAASLLLPNVVSLTSSVDFTAGETLSGHRLLFSNGFYFAAFSTTSGQELSILRVRTDLQRDGFAPVVSASSNTKDFFLASNGPNVSVGVFQPSNGHTVHILKADFSSRSTATIGGFSFPQKNGAGAAWRASDSIFELWTPDTLDFHGPSDLHRVFYDANWTPTTADVKVVADPLLVETMPTAVTVDAQTGVTIVHYVVADNPPLDVNFPGSGRIHRRLYNALGTEIPGSHTVLSFPSCNRPAATILGNFLYVGFETTTGVTVERYQLLR